MTKIEQPIFQVDNLEIARRLSKAEEPAAQVLRACNALATAMIRVNLSFTKAGEDFVAVMLGLNRLRLEHRYQRDHGTRQIRMRKGHRANRR